MSVTLISKSFLVLTSYDCDADDKSIFGFVEPVYQTPPPGAALIDS